MTDKDISNILPRNMHETVERAGISTAKQILLFSIWDIKKLTNMQTEDIRFMKGVVADHLSPESTTCYKLLEKEKENSRVTTGCGKIDKLLRGGLRRGTLTELYGESGSGKTQLALQAALNNWPEGCAYICTEDMFPVKRFEQMKQALPDYNPYIDYEKHIFVEHLTEAPELLSCLRVRLPKLLDGNHLSLIVIDSVAAPFRSEYSNYIQRAEDLRELACALIILAQKHNLAVLCINQVTAAFNETDEVLPSLGLTWSNMVSTRLGLKKTSKTIYVPNQTDKGNRAKQSKVNIRELSVIFAPDLPNSTVNLVINESGVLCQ